MDYIFTLRVVERYRQTRYSWHRWAAGIKHSHQANHTFAMIFSNIHTANEWAIVRRVRPVKSCQDLCQADQSKRKKSDPSKKSAPTCCTSTNLLSLLWSFEGRGLNHSSHNCETFFVWLVAISPNHVWKDPIPCAMSLSIYRSPIRLVNNIPTMQFSNGISRNTQSKSYILSFTECVWDFQNKALWDTH